MSCPACYHQGAKRAFSVKNVKFIQCESCETIRSERPLTSIATHNDSPELRNDDEQNSLRLERVTEALGYKPNTALDFGCGNGELIDFLTRQGINAVGIDRDIHHDVPSNSLDAVFLVEVIEHINFPQYTFLWMRHNLLPGGVIYVETTFADHIQSPENHPYVDPTIGHTVILSIKGLEESLPEGLILHSIVNDNVVILQKPAKLST